MTVIPLPDVKSPKDVVQIYYNYLREDCSVTCEAWCGQFRIDQLVKVGAKIQKVEVINASANQASNNKR